MKLVHISVRRSTARQHRQGCYVRGFAESRGLSKNQARAERAKMQVYIRCCILRFFFLSDLQVHVLRTKEHVVCYIKHVRVMAHIIFFLLFYMEILRRATNVLCTPEHVSFAAKHVQWLSL